MTLSGVRIARVATVSYSLLQVEEQVRALVAAGARVSVVCSEFESAPQATYGGAESQISIFIARTIDPLADIISFYRLCRLFRQQGFHIVHSTTPKAGLLCAIAGWLMRVPVRLHTFTGQPWATKVGPVRWLLKLCDWLIVRLNTHCYADSASQRAFLIDQRVAVAARVTVLGSGSLAGVDTHRFNSERFSTEANRATRAEIGVPANARVVLFVGRLNADKGLKELYSAFSLLSQEVDDVWLVMVGPAEAGCDVIFRASAGKHAVARIVFVESTPTPERYMAASDLLCLPSYREGFGSVIIEAGAMGVPAVGTDIYGIVDAIKDGQTGLLVKPRQVTDLYRGLKTLIGEDRLRRQMGINAQSRARELFDSRLVAAASVLEYQRLLTGGLLPAQR